MLSTLPLAEASASNQRTTTSIISAKFSPTFNPFGWDLIGAPAMSINNIVFVACQDLFSGNGADEDFKAAEARKRKERRAASLVQETDEEKRIRLDKRKLNDKKRRENEESSARQARQSANKDSLNKARAGQNEEATKARQAADKASHARARAGENEEAHARRLELQRPRNAAAASPTGPRTWKRNGFTVYVPRQAPLQMRSPG